jgi:G3E family GTPase
VAQTFFVDDDVQRQMALDAIVTVVDAKHIWAHVDSSPEAKEQIAFADVILLNKIDLVPKAEVRRLETRLRAINMLAKIYHTRNAELEIARLLDIGAFDLSRKLEIDPNFLGEDTHQHDPTVYSVALVEDGEVSEAKMNDWLRDVLTTMGVDIFRMKGILNMQGRDERFVFQGVHMLFDGRPDRTWKRDESRQNQLVFIGRALDRAKLSEGFRACLV